MNGVRFIAGSGRSGTTWVLDSLATANGLRPVFEPLNPFASDLGARYAHRALRPGEPHPELEAFLADVIAGRRARLWTQFRRQRNWVFPVAANFRTAATAGRYFRRLARFAAEGPGLARFALRREPIVKCIWANLMLDWLASRFKCRVVLIVRHPGAVIESEMRGGWTADGTLQRFRDDPTFHDVTDGRYARQLERKPGGVEALALRWVIENQSHVERRSSDAVAVAYYEELAGQDFLAWAPVCAHLGVRHRPEDAVLAQPSQQSSTRATRSSDEMAGTSWRNALGAERTARIQAVLDESGFDGYSMTEARPKAIAKAPMAAGGAAR